MVSSGHVSEEDLNHSALHWTACHEAVCKYHDGDRFAGQIITPESPEVVAIRAGRSAEGSEVTRPRIDLDGVRKRLATALEHDDPLAECEECECHDQRAHDAFMAKRKKPLLEEVYPTTTEPFLRSSHLPYHIVNASSMTSSKMRKTPRALSRYLMSAIPFRSLRKCRACGENSL